MTGPTSEQLDDAQVLARIREIWPEVNGWTARTQREWAPQPGSALAVADDQTGGQASYIARASLAAGSEAIVMACTWLNNHGPTVFAVGALLRTALIGGAQAVWTLSGIDTNERVERVRMVQRESVLRHDEWLRDAEGTIGAEEIDVGRIRGVLASITDELGNVRPARMTKMVTEATRYAFEGDQQVVAAALLEWRAASGLAHALPWDLNTRAQNQTVTERDDGRLSVETRATLSDHQAALGIAHTLLNHGWHLLERLSEPAA